MRVEHLLLFLPIVTRSQLWPKRPINSSGPVQGPSTGDPLYLTPFLAAGDVEGARAAAAVDSTALVGQEEAEPVESYSGFITVDEETESNMFFWYFPASVSVKMLAGFGEQKYV